MTEREEKSDCNRAPPFLHQLAGDVVDRRNMVCVKSVPQPEAVSQERGAQEDRIAAKFHQRPQPGADIGGDKDRIHADDLAARLFRRVVKDARKHGGCL